jgi:hypothetical protein
MRRQWRRWPLIAAAAVIVTGCSMRLASFWLAREQVDFYWNRYAVTPVPDLLRRFEWGAEHSTIIDPDDGGPGYIGTTVLEWTIGPFTVTKVIYSRP